MSTVAVIAIVVAALILLAIVVSVVRSNAHRRQIAQAQTEAKRDDAQHHHDRAVDRRHEAELAEEQAKRARAEAELDERRAAGREQELGETPREQPRTERPGGTGPA